MVMVCWDDGLYGCFQLILFDLIGKDKKVIRFTVGRKVSN